MDWDECRRYELKYFHKIRSTTLCLRLFANLLNGCHDVRIGAAAADVSIHALLDVFIAGSTWLLQQSDSRHNLSGGAVAALKTIMLDESSLRGMEMIGLAESFDGGDMIVAYASRRMRGRSSLGAINVDCASPHWQ